MHRIYVSVWVATSDSLWKKNHGYMYVLTRLVVARI